MGPSGVSMGNVAKRCWATQREGNHRTERSTLLQVRRSTESREVTVSPVLQKAVLSSQLGSDCQGTWRGSRVSGRRARQVGSEVDKASQRRGKRLLSEMSAAPLLVTGVRPPRRRSGQ